jgi:hypothetical protein
MRARRQQVGCSIAGKLVDVSSRRGRGFHEPAGHYVRCEERDCQYVDLNQPPCPLRSDMFGGVDQERVGQFLAAQMGQRVCYACFMEALSISHAEMRRAAWRFTEEGTATIGPGRCSVCRRRRVCLTALDGAALRVTRDHSANEVLEPDVDAPGVRSDRDRGLHTQPHERILAFLGESSGFAYCAACLALSTQLSLIEVRGLLADLKTPAVEQHEDMCSACGRSQTVTTMPRSWADHRSGGDGPSVI